MTPLKPIALLWLLCCLGTPAFAQQILYVDDDAPLGGDGTSWETPFKYFQNAMWVAWYGGIEEIHVAGGVHHPDQYEGDDVTPGDRSESYWLMTGVSIYGGYAGYGAPDPEARNITAYETILSGDLADNDDPDFANNDENSYHVVYAQDIDATALLDGFTITGGNADSVGNWEGAGAWCRQQANPTIRNCTIVGNSAFAGGGLFCDGESNLSIINCIISGNTAGASGGGGIFCDYYSSVTLTNCTIISNHARGTVGGFICNNFSHAIVTNCVFWANTRYEIAVTHHSTALVTYSNVQGGWPGEGNINEDPHFLGDNPRLVADSPCIDAGNNAAVPANVGFDIEGGLRFVDDPTVDPDPGNGTPPVVDMGAYEYQEDCNGNGTIDSVDLFAGTSDDCTGNGIPDECEPDCNGNGVADSCDIVGGTSNDCNTNDVPDECEPGGTEDCNGNGIPDLCDLYFGTSQDCNENEIPDECEPGGTEDCNCNSIPDICDIYLGTSEDCNANSIPDECDIAAGSSEDCQPNEIPDECDIDAGASPDCNGNAVPDECDIALGTSGDCQPNEVPDECDIAAGTSEDCTGNMIPDECEPDCNGNGVADSCDIAEGTSQDCQPNEIPDECDLASGTSEDCQANDIPDECDIAAGTSDDCTDNGIPDECEADCNGNGVADSCDIDEGTSQDCNENAVPDECEPGGAEDCNGNGVSDLCDIYSGTSQDCQPNDVPDECDITEGTSEDCQLNEIPDECDIDVGTSQDCNENSSPDECDIDAGTSEDCQTNGVPDECDLADGTSPDCNENSVPDECDLAGDTSRDCQPNGIPDECDIADGGSADYDLNGIPDVCDPDCNVNGVPDTCDVDCGAGNCASHPLGCGGSVDTNGDGIPDECDEIFVNDQTGDDAWDGLCEEWDGGTCGPKQTIQAGIDAADSADTVIVAGGIYTGAGNKNLDFGGRAIIVRSVSGPQNCIIDCADDGRGFHFHNGETQTSVLDGFTIANGNDWYGAGIHCSFSSPTIVNCVITGCQAYYRAGGVHLGDSAAALQNCIITGNTAAYGAGLYCDNSVSGDVPTITNCTITGNTADYTGGGVYFTWSSAAEITNCILWENMPEEIHADAADELNVSYSVIQGGWSGWGWGNVDADPRFNDPPGPDGVFGTLDDELYLLPGSPCIDAGDNNAVPSAILSDIEGAPRFVDDPTVDPDPGHGSPPVVDMGAFEYQADCNGNGTIDSADILFGTSADCQPNGVPDECDIAVGTSLDCQPNGIPDECEIDCNFNGIPDDCDIAGGTSEDVNDNGIPDECEFLYVNGATGDDAWDGLCEEWDGGMCGPKQTIQAGIDAAIDHLVLVADGIYTGTGNYKLDFNGKAIVVRCTGGPQACVIDCAEMGPGFFFHSDESHTSVVDGFTITNGRYWYGGGIYCSHSSPLITNCILTDNIGLYRGGGVYLGVSDAVIDNCTIVANTARYGGGVYSSGDNPVVSNCTIMGNSADNDGGGVFYTWSGHPTVRNCIIAGNTAGSRGAAVYCNTGTHGNQTLTNSTLVDNTAGATGGGVHCASVNSPVLNGCILWNNTPAEIYHEEGDLVATYSDVRGAWPGAGNINADPVFVDPDGPDNDPNTWIDNNYHLTAGSPCLDAGDPSFVPPPDETDIDGQPRLADADGDGTAVVDIGADEFTQLALGDLNCDGVVNYDDIDAFVLALADVDAYYTLYPNGDHLLADLNGDGAANSLDIDPFIALLGG